MKISKLIINIILSLLLFCYPLSYFSQKIGTKISVSKPDIKKAFTQYNFTNYDIEQGLNSSYILSLMFDSKGFLWIGTTNGVSMFNGLEFKNFTISNGLASDIVQDIAEDENGNIYFACYGGGISVYDGYNLNNFNEKHGLKNLNVWCIFIDNSKNIIIGTENGIYYKNKNTFSEFKYNSQIGSYPIRNIIQDNTGKYWISTDGNYIFTFKDDILIHLTKNDGIVSNRVNSIYVDKKNNIWIGTYGAGLIRINSHNEKKYFITDSNINSKFINRIISDSNDRIIIASSNGAYYIDNNENIITHKFENSLKNEVLLDIAVDKHFNTWYASYGGGLIKFNGNLFTYLNTESNLPTNNIKGIKSYNNDLWFATSGSGVCRYDGSYIYNYNFNNGLSNNYILSIESDSNYLWLGTSGGGLNQFNSKENIYFTKKDNYYGDYVLALHKRNTDLWIGTYGNGMSLYSDQTFKKFYKKEGLESNVINSIASDNIGKIWIATESHGLYSFYKDIFIKHLSFIKSFKTVFFDKLNNILLAGSVGNGLFVVNKSDTIIITENEGLINNYVQSIILNGDNYIIGTNKGISIINIHDIKNYNKETLKFKNYNVLNGFIGNNCLSNSIYTDSLNRTWVGTGRNLTCFNPEIDDINTVTPYVYIDNVELFFEKPEWQIEKNNKNVDFDSIIPYFNIPNLLNLPYYNNHITFHFNAINFKQPDGIQYSFYLEGLEGSWSKLSRLKQITYSSLPEGNYCFKVKAFNEDGIESEKKCEFYITINPPWWKTKWFNIFLIIIILIFIYSIIKFREKKLQKDKKRLEKIVKERTQEVVQQKEEIESQRDNLAIQNDIINHQKKEILDSIIYAKRIQNAILPIEDSLNSKKLQAFVLFLPKDIVSGDFFWHKKINHYSIYCVADCTGHGVPGAFMSMLGISTFNEIINNIDLSKTNSGKILDLLRSKIIITLNSFKTDKESEIKDGMDLSFVIINTSTNIFQFSGANNSLYLIRRLEDYKFEDSDEKSPNLDILKSLNLEVDPSSNLQIFQSDESVLIEIKGDKMPIAVYEKMDSFKTNEIKFEESDTIYLFSDGYADQFGGENGKKFKYKPFKDMLLLNSNLSLIEQKDKYLEIHKNWKQDISQVDDICIIGIKSINPDKL